MIKQTYISTRGLKNGAYFSIPSMLASVCTKAIGIMKKKVRKKNATVIISLRTLRWTYGIAKFGQYTSRGSGAHSVNQIVGFLVCWVCAQTAAPHRVLKETKAAGITHLGSCSTLSRSSAIWHDKVKWKYVKFPDTMFHNQTAVVIWLIYFS